MIKIILSLSIIIQIPFIAMAEMWSVEPFSFEWWMMQFFGFVMATNLGAVILAMIAQDSATKIGAIQSTAFTAEFMEGVETLTKIMTTFNETASEENESLDSQIDEFAPAFYRLALQYLRTHAEACGCEKKSAEDFEADFSQEAETVVGTMTRAMENWEKQMQEDYEMQQKSASESFNAERRLKPNLPINKWMIIPFLSVFSKLFNNKEACQKLFNEISTAVEFQ